ncbi:hypothetical protein LCGC14_2394650 [marine sediment metagenome]|uniref:Response regulatory domain-containing protein n=1 Tax=marine sediment metagenome TaxID=412755 RepID=A0A0F9BX81_9ZZZZ
MPAGSGSCNTVSKSFQEHCFEKDQNGSIGIEAVEGKGKTFHIYLPKALSLEEDGSKEVIGVVGGNETVLIVEDEEMVLNLAKEVLDNFGYKVLTAQDSRKGILSKAKSYVTKPYKPTDLAQTVRTVLDL